MTLSELMHYWLDNYAKVHCKKWRAFQREFELYLSTLGNRDLNDIRRSDVVALQSKLATSNGKSAANAAVTLLTMLYNKAIDWELHEGRNPASRIRKFRLKPRERFLQPEELPRFLDAVDRCRYATTRDYFLVLLFTGQRRRNTAEMRWDDVDFNRRVWRIPDTKNGTSHTVPLIEPVIDILIRRRNAHPIWVFPRKDGTGPLWSKSCAWDGILKRAGITGLQIHDLRRSLASWRR
jgi:integrase